LLLQVPYFGNFDLAVGGNILRENARKAAGFNRCNPEEKERINRKKQSHEALKIHHKPVKISLI